MSSIPCFDTLLLLARPAAGKSEIIDFLHKVPLDERLARYHVGELTVIDDFPMLWTWFEEDDILEQLGHPRLYTDSEGYFLSPYLWDVLIRRLCLEHSKWKRDTKDQGVCQTAIIEFSRGSEHGGYERAFRNLSQDVTREAAILYVDVSWEESLRKNQKRFNPNRPDSILEHALPSVKLKRLYQEVDWFQISRDHTDTVEIQGVSVPYVIFDNHDDVTSDKGKALAERLEFSLAKLWDLKCKSD